MRLPSFSPGIRWNIKAVRKPCKFKLSLIQPGHEKLLKASHLPKPGRQLAPT